MEIKKTISDMKSELNDEIENLNRMYEKGEMFTEFYTNAMDMLEAQLFVLADLENRLSL